MSSDHGVGRGRAVDAGRSRRGLAGTAMQSASPWYSPWDDDREVREAFAGSSRRSASRFSSAQEFLRSSNDLLRNDTDFNVAAFDRRSRGWCF